MDWLDRFATKTLQTIKKGYYRVREEKEIERKSLANAIINSDKIPVIAELKIASPTRVLIKSANANKIINLYSSSAIAGISVVTEPYFFKGSLENLKLAALTGKPVLMKDFLITKEQILAARKLGASAILLILELFERGYSEENLEAMIRYAHEKGLEVVLEVYSKEEYKKACATNANIIGINNRDLKNLKVDLRRTEMILKGIKKEKPVISMSGISCVEDIKRLTRAGADALLIGTALSKAPNIEQKLNELIL